MGILILNYNRNKGEYESPRRHSLAGALFSSDPIFFQNFEDDKEVFEDDIETKPVHTSEPQIDSIQTEINDYFGNTEHRTKAWVEAGKNLVSQQEQMSQTWVLILLIQACLCC